MLLLSAKTVQIAFNNNLILQGDWKTICIRGCTPEVPEADECVDQSTDEPALVASLQNKANPVPKLGDAGISIFDLYRHESASSSDHSSAEEFYGDEFNFD